MKPLPKSALAVAALVTLGRVLIFDGKRDANEPQVAHQAGTKEAAGAIGNLEESAPVELQTPPSGGPSLATGTR